MMHLEPAEQGIYIYVLVGLILTSFTHLLIPPRVIKTWSPKARFRWYSWGFILDVATWILWVPFWLLALVTDRKELEERMIEDSQEE